MTTPDDGETVTVHYTGRTEDGTVFDTSEDSEPISFEVGADEVIPGFEKAVAGLEPGETETAVLPPEQAYGPRSEDRLVPVPREELPGDLDPEVGDDLQLRLEDGQTAAARVTDTDEATVTLDLNHPLAGHELTFDVTLVSIE